MVILLLGPSQINCKSWQSTLLYLFVKICNSKTVPGDCINMKYTFTTNFKNVFYYICFWCSYWNDTMWLSSFIANKMFQLHRILKWVVINNKLLKNTSNYSRFNSITHFETFDITKCLTLSYNMHKSRIITKYVLILHTYFTYKYHTGS